MSTQTNEPIQDDADTPKQARPTRRALLRGGLALALTPLGALASCAAPEALAPTVAPSAAPLTATPPPPTRTALPPTATPQPEPTRFAVIGDFGLAGASAAAVARMVVDWSPDFVVTTGDNNYPAGKAETLDPNVGQYYHSFIHPYRGVYGPGAAENRFWPVLGNHDWDQGPPEAYLRYFTLPGNGRYYSLARGPVRFLMLNSFFAEPDGFEADSRQAAWLRDELAAAREPWKVVVFHHPPFSSGHHGPAAWMRWPFRAWGADVVLTGHDHNYERLEVDGLLYLVNGLGGGSRYAPGSEADPNSAVFFNADWGALFVEASADALTFSFATIGGREVDRYELVRAEQRRALAANSVAVG